MIRDRNKSYHEPPFYSAKHYNVETTIWFLTLSTTILSLKCLSNMYKIHMLSRVNLPF